MMPEPHLGELAAQYRVRLREFFDFHERRDQTVESSRRSWVDICLRHEVASGLDFTADDPRPAVRVPSMLPKPPKPISTMTNEERAAYRCETWLAMGQHFDERPAEKPSPPANETPTHDEG